MPTNLPRVTFSIVFAVPRDTDIYIKVLYVILKKEPTFMFDG